MGMLDNKVAIVTGGARGIGRAVATRFIADGASVVIADVDESAGNATAAEMGPHCRFVRADVGDARHAANLVDAAAKAFTGNIDILVNNAGIIHTASFLEIDET